MPRCTTVFGQCRVVDQTEEDESDAARIVLQDVDAELREGSSNSCSLTDQFQYLPPGLQQPPTPKACQHDRDVDWTEGEEG